MHRLSSGELGPARTAQIRALMAIAFGDDPEERFGDTDWDHALGGTHVILEVDGVIVAHASVVERWIEIGGRPLRTGYVEAVATEPARQGTGLGTRLMTEIGTIIRDRFELGLLGTGRHHFYERLGWRTWRGPSGWKGTDGIHWTPDDDGFLLVLETPRTPKLDQEAPILCEWRAGDVW